MVDVVAYQPDIALNFGALIRLCACTGCRLHLIDPCGFPFSVASFRRSAMDYIDMIELVRHISEDDFFSYAKKHNLRTVLLSSKATTSYRTAEFRDNDALIVGRESAGVPESFAGRCDISLTIPMKGKARSLNVVNAAAMTLGEALRQTEITE